MKDRLENHSQKVGYFSLRSTPISDKLLVDPLTTDHSLIGSIRLSLVEFEEDRYILIRLRVVVLTLQSDHPNQAVRVARACSRQQV